jgi:deazaflavin-dependent oxidoreductase (nitroreductase family)
MGGMSDEAELLRRVEAAEEVEIETRRRTGESRRTIIWIVADGGRIYVRSVRGPGGKWYQRLRANPDGAIHVAGTSTPVRAVPVSDAAEIERVSEALRRKYARHRSSLASMLRPETLPTTLRLEPVKPA